jgi:tRNA threonylcarbamoyladenosine biosynthesis protein TsaB
MDGSATPGINLLVFDTSTEQAVIALLTASGALHTASTDANRRHGRDLIPRIRKVLDEAGVAMAEIQVLAVGLGPGSYTGLRVGLMAAKTLAYTTGAALVGLDSLEVIARNAPENALRVTVLADAQRGDVYTASFTRSASGEALVRTTATTSEPFAAWLQRFEPGTHILGPALSLPRIREALPPDAIVPDVVPGHPSPERLLECAYQAWQSGQRDDFWTLEPLYLRRSSAEEQWDRRNEAVPTASASMSTDATEAGLDSPTTRPGTP